MKNFKYAVGVLLLSVLVVVLSWTVAQNRSSSDLSVDLLNPESSNVLVLKEGSEFVIELKNSSSEEIQYSSSHPIPSNWLSITGAAGDIESKAKAELRLMLSCQEGVSAMPIGDLVITYQGGATGELRYGLELNCSASMPEETTEESTEETQADSTALVKVTRQTTVNTAADASATLEVQATSAVAGAQGAAGPVQPFALATPSVVSPAPSAQSLERVRGEASMAPPPPPVVTGYDDDSKPTQTPQDNEVYTTITENQFLDVFDNPVSTFSVDVDTASYSNIRRMLRDGYLPPADAVRTEEFINYFSYDYADPEDGSHPFAIHTDFATAPWNTEHQLLRIGLQGKHIDVSQLPPSNLVFLIDVSGSMADDIALVKTAFSILTDNMRSTDRVAIVVYAGAAGVVLDSTPGNRQSKIMDALNKLQAGGSTAGGAGIELAYSIAQENYISEGNNRIILATDGDFNVGASSEAELERLIVSKRDDGIFLSMLGFGQGNYHDSYMELLADKGNGNYAYIDSALEARKVLFEQFAGTLFTIAKDVKIQLEFNPLKVKSYRLIGYENRMLAREDFDNDKKDAGEIGAGHSVTALYEVIPVTDGETPTGENVYTTTTVSDAALANDLMTIRFRYKPPHLDESRLLEQRVAYELNDMSVDFNFASAVAEFTLLLRDSEFKANADYDQIIERAKASKGKDDEGCRAEFIQLVKQAQLLSN